MAEKNEYLQEAYQDLLKLSADDKKRMEYEAREKAIRDYNSQIKSATKQGLEQGIEIGEERGIKIGEARGESQGIELARKVLKASMAGKSPEKIAEELELPLDKVRGILE